MAGRLCLLCVCGGLMLLAVQEVKAAHLHPALSAQLSGTDAAEQADTAYSANVKVTQTASKRRKRSGGKFFIPVYRKTGGFGGGGLIYGHGGLGFGGLWGRGLGWGPQSYIKRVSLYPASTGGWGGGGVHHGGWHSMHGGGWGGGGGKILGVLYGGGGID